MRLAVLECHSIETREWSAMLFCYLTQHNKLDRSFISKIMTLDRFSKCKHRVKAKLIDVAGQQHLIASGWLAIWYRDRVTADCIVSNLPTVLIHLFVMRRHLSRNSEASVRTIYRLSQEFASSSRIRKSMRFVMALPIIHHKQYEVKLRTLFV